MGFPKRVKDPDAVLDFPSDWSDWLPEGDTIVAATAVVTGGSFVVDQVTFTTTKVVAWVSGGALAETGVLTYHITTNEGREDDRSVNLVCKER